MLRTRRLLRPIAAAVGLLALGASTLVAPGIAAADATDGRLTVIVDRDEDADGAYDGAIDTPQAGIRIVVSDAAGKSVSGVTDGAGTFVLEPTATLGGGRYFVTAEIPADRPELVPVPESATYSPFSTTVDITSESVAVRMGVMVGTIPPSVSSQPEPSQTPTERPAAPRFAIGDFVWRDTNRSGRQDPDETGAARISVQLLNANGEVVGSTVTSQSGHFSFDMLSAGVYSVRFAGVPAGFRLAPTGAGDDRADDSNPDYTGATPPFALGVGEPNVRAATAGDRVEAEYINSTIDAGIAPLRYAVGGRVWLDANGDGIAQSDEPGAGATVTLLAADGTPVAAATTDGMGHYMFNNVSGGRYRVRFSGLGPNRAFTLRGAGADRTADSDADPTTGITALFSLSLGAPNLMPTSSASDPTNDFVNPSIDAGIVGSYSIGDTVWLDNNGDGVLDAGDTGVPGVRVELLDANTSLLAVATTSDTGRFTFRGLRAGSYQLRFSGLPEGLIFSGQHRGSNEAVDSDADSGGLTPLITLGDDNPADTTVDAGLTTPSNYTPSPTRSPSARAVDTELPGTPGVGAELPLSGLALVVSGIGCLLAARRRM